MPFKVQHALVPGVSCQTSVTNTRQPSYTDSWRTYATSAWEHAILKQPWLRPAEDHKKKHNCRSPRSRGTAKRLHCSRTIWLLRTRSSRTPVTLRNLPKYVPQHKTMLEFVDHS